MGGDEVGQGEGGLVVWGGELRVRRKRRVAAVLETEFKWRLSRMTMRGTRD